MKEYSKMSLEDLACELASAWEVTGKEYGKHKPILAELRRRDEAVLKLVAASRLVVSDHENLEPTAHSIEDMGRALAAFPGTNE